MAIGLGGDRLPGLGSAPRAHPDYTTHCRGVSPPPKGRSRRGNDCDLSVYGSIGADSTIARVRNAMNTTLQQAIAAIETGDTWSAQQLLIQVLRAEPRNETAWLWLSTTFDDLEKRHYCLRQVLALNPDNELALEWQQQLATRDPSETLNLEDYAAIARAARQSTGKQPAAQGPGESTTTSSRVVAPTPADVQSAPQHTERPEVSMYLLAGLAVAVVVVLVALVVLLVRSPLSASLRTSSETPTTPRVSAPNPTYAPTPTPGILSDEAWQMTFDPSGYLPAEFSLRYAMGKTAGSCLAGSPYPINCVIYALDWYDEGAAWVFVARYQSGQDAVEGYGRELQEMEEDFVEGYSEVVTLKHLDDVGETGLLSINTIPWPGSESFDSSTLVFTRCNVVVSIYFINNPYVANIESYAQIIDRKIQELPWCR